MPASSVRSRIQHTDIRKTQTIHPVKDVGAGKKETHADAEAVKPYRWAVLCFCFCRRCGLSWSRQTPPCCLLYRILSRSPLPLTSLVHSLRPSLSLFISLYLCSSLAPAASACGFFSFALARCLEWQELFAASLAKVRSGMTVDMLMLLMLLM